MEVYKCTKYTKPLGIAVAFLLPDLDATKELGFSFATKCQSSPIGLNSIHPTCTALVDGVGVFGGFGVTSAVD